MNINRSRSLRVAVVALTLSAILVSTPGCSARGLRAFVAVASLVAVTAHAASAIAHAVAHSHHHHHHCGHRRVLRDGRRGYYHEGRVEYWDPDQERWYYLERGH